MGRPRHPGTRLTVMCCAEPTGTEDGGPLGNSSRAGVRGGACEEEGTRLGVDGAQSCYLLVGSQKTEALTLLDRLSHAAVCP